jgi:hypothetical protein
MNVSGWAAGTALVVACVAGVANAGTVSVSLGQSSQNYTLYGQGAIAPDQGSFTNQQGSSTFDGTTTTDTLSGAIASGSPGFGSGTWQFITTFAGANTPEAGPNAPNSFSSSPGSDFFNYGVLNSSVDMTLILDTTSGDYTLPVVTNGVFDGPGFSLGFVSPVCTGVATCDQNLVGLTPGATESGQIVMDFSFSVPEPATWAMLLAGFAGLGAALRFRRARDLAA